MEPRIDDRDLAQEFLASGGSNLHFAGYRVRIPVSRSANAAKTQKVSLGVLHGLAKLRETGVK